MELPSEILIHCPVMGLKGAQGVLLRVSEHGYYEANVTFGERLHRVLLPIEQTAIIQKEPEEQIASVVEVER